MEHGFWHRLYSREPQGGRKGIGWLAKEPAADSPAEMLDAQSRTVPAEILYEQAANSPPDGRRGMGCRIKAAQEVLGSGFQILRFILKYRKTFGFS